MMKTAELRSLMRLKRKNMTEQEIKEKSQKIKEKLGELLDDSSVTERKISRFTRDDNHTVISNAEACLACEKSFTRVKNIMAYFPYGNEVDIREFLEKIIEKKQHVILPRVIDNKNIKGYFVHDLNIGLELEKGYAGIFEPVLDERECDLKSIDLVIIPGTVFDKKCNRIGMGKGFYDRFLADMKNINKNVKFIGVCYDYQIVEEFDVKPRDIAMDMVISDKNTYFYED